MTPPVPSPTDARPPRPVSGPFRQAVEFLAILGLSILLFRTFAAEAYVVPTGSMAPTLLGNHREVTCPSCGFRFALGLDEDERAGLPVCPNCGQDNLRDAPTVDCGGDRVLVQKFLFDWRRPRRWEAAVFHFPNEPSQAYVKRVVGLPHESIQVVNGDVFVNGRIARKSLAEQRAVRVLVHDHRFEPRDRRSRWEPRRGRSEPLRPSAWTPRGAAFVHGSSDRPAEAVDWLEYRNLDPDRGKPWPVYDFNAYNGRDLRGENVVNDLILEARLTIDQPLRALTIRINSGSDRWIATVARGRVEVDRNGNAVPVTSLRSSSDVPGVGPHRLEASVVDQRFSVALDGALLFAPIDYDDPTTGPGPGDRPIGLGVQGGSVTVGDLKVFRDIHYTSALVNGLRRPFGVDAPYQLGADEYFVLGDNSAVSNDSRFWSGSPVVPGPLLVGKPFLVHLPGAVVPLRVFGRSGYWVPDPREIRYIR